MVSKNKIKGYLKIIIISNENWSTLIKGLHKKTNLILTKTTWQCKINQLFTVLPAGNNV